MNNLKEQLIAYCLNNDYKYDCGYDWCDCVDFSDYVNVLIKGKWHTLYCLNNGGYRFDKTLVNSMEEVEEIVNEKQNN